MATVWQHPWGQKTWPLEGCCPKGQHFQDLDVGVLRWALYQSDVHGRTGLYVFPTARDVHDFSTARIKPVIDRSDYLRGRQRPTDPHNKGLMSVGDGLVYFRGSEARRGLDSVDADYVVFDEYDTLAHQNIPDAERRVTGPLSAGLIRRVGVPPIPDWGIARLYDQSDQRRWHVRCAACGEWQVVSFEDNVDTGNHRVVCSKCGKPLDVTAGEWVATYPDRSVSGYHVCAASPNRGRSAVGEGL